MKALTLTVALVLALSVGYAQWPQDESMAARRSKNKAPAITSSVPTASVNGAVIPEGRFILKPDDSGVLNIDAGLARSFQRALDSVGWKYGVRGMSAAVLIPGKGIWLGTYGYSTTAPDSIRPETIFSIASQTKTFAGVLVLKLAEEGRLSLNDTIGRYLTNLPASISGRITIRQILNMTSGIYDYITDGGTTWRNAVLANINRYWTPEDILSTLALPYAMTPGSTWWYSNTNAILAGMITRNISQTNVATQLHQRILSPLSLAHTFFPPEDSLIGRIVHPWSYGNDVSSWYGTSMHSTSWTAGAMYSTAEDMARWVNALYGGQILTPASLAELQTAITIPLQDRISAGEISEEAYGLCAIRYTFHGKSLWGHSGSNFGYSSLSTYRPGDSVSVALLSNWRPGDGAAARVHVFESVSALYTRMLQSKYPWLSVTTNTVALGAVPQALARFDTSFLVSNQGVGVDSISVSLDSTLYSDSTVTISPHTFALGSGASQRVAFSFSPQKLQPAKLYRTVVKVDSRFSAGPTHVEKTFTFGATTTTLYLNTARFELWNLPRTASRFDTTFLVTNYGAVSDSVYLSIDPVNTTPDSALSVSPRSCALPRGASIVVTFSIKPWLLSTGTTYNAAVILDSRFGVGQTHFEKAVVFTLTNLVAVGSESSLPATFRLERNYPNPFNPTTGIRFQVPGTSWVRLVVYDLLGREVATLVDEEKAPGTYQVQFDANGLASGVYLYRMVAGIYTCTRKMIVMK